MAYKLNGGSGAIICDKCRIIIKAPAPEVWRVLPNWGETHYCDECNPRKRFIKAVKEIVDEDG